MASTQLGTAWRQIHYLFGEGSLAGLSDAQLLDRYHARGDERAFAVLVDRHGALVLATCRSVLHDTHDSEDAFQATFLILARKAGSIRNRQAVGAWLHRVSRRVAVQASDDEKRRRRQEWKACLARCESRSSDDATHDLGTVLHEEIDRLPDRHRLPFVLCHLEEIGHAQAAQQLGWSERTLRRRLAEARARLQLRLARRGIAIPAAALARATPAIVPPAWTETVCRMNSFGVAPAGVFRLVRAVLRSMLLGKIKLAATTALAVGMLVLSAGILGLGRDEPAAPTPAPGNEETRPQSQPAPRAAAVGDTVAYTGRVLDPQGKPFLGATIFLSYDPSKEPRRPLVRATSDANGQFQFAVPKALFDANYEDEPWQGVAVVAQAKGFGLGIGKHPDRDEPATLQLAEDLPIAGRIVDLQGRPIAGVTIRPRTVRGTVRGDLDPLLKVSTDRKAAAESPVPDRTFVDLMDNLAPVVTGPDGRFRLEGLGRERLVAAIVEGPGIETAWIDIMTRRAPTIRATQPNGQIVTIYGAEFEHVAGPSQPIVGVVRDADTGAPIEGVEIQGNYPAGFVNYIKGVTDQAGRYRLDGLPAGRNARLSAVATKGEPYLQSVQEVSNNVAPQPTEVAFTLKRGVWITGRVTERTTGRPVRGQIDYYVFTDNPHAREARHFSGSPELKWTAPDGSYRVAGLPGPGIIGVRAHAREDYCVGLGAENIHGKQSNGWFSTQPHFVIAVNFNTLAEVNPPEGVAEVACDLTVDPGRTVKVTVLDNGGVPLAGAIVLGRQRSGWGWPLLPLKTAEFDVVRLAANEARTLTILHDERKLAGGLVVRGDSTESSPATVRLEPWGVVTGRVVDEQGEPLSGVEVNGMDRPRFDPVDGGLGPGVPVNEDGRFRIEGLVPGRRYTFRLARRRYGLGTLVEGLTVAPGETRDLGDVRAKSD